MTDNDITKALECLTGGFNILCHECAFNGKFPCRENAAKAALDLIKCQQAKIKELINKMRTIKELVNSTEKKVYVYLADTETGEQFVKDAMREGYHFGDGAEIASRQQDEFYAVNKDLTINYLNSIGRMAFQSGTDNILRIDYKKYINGNDDYII